MARSRSRASVPVVAEAVEEVAPQGHDRAHPGRRARRSARARRGRRRARGRRRGSSLPRAGRRRGAGPRSRAAASEASGQGRVRAELASSSSAGRAKTGARARGQRRRAGGGRVPSSRRPSGRARQILRDGAGRPRRARATTCPPPTARRQAPTARCGAARGRSAISRCRPKKSPACSASNGRSPRYGFSSTALAPGGGGRAQVERAPERLGRERAWFPSGTNTASDGAQLHVGERVQQRDEALDVRQHGLSVGVRAGAPQTEEHRGPRPGTMTRSARTSPCATPAACSAASAPARALPRDRTVAAGSGVGRESSRCASLEALHDAGGLAPLPDTVDAAEARMGHAGQRPGAREEGRTGAPDPAGAGAARRRDRACGRARERPRSARPSGRTMRYSSFDRAPVDTALIGSTVSSCNAAGATSAVQSRGPTHSCSDRPRSRSAHHTIRECGLRPASQALRGARLSAHISSEPVSAV